MYLCVASSEAAVNVFIDAVLSTAASFPKVERSIQVLLELFAFVLSQLAIERPLRVSSA